MDASGRLRVCLAEGGAGGFAARLATEQELGPLPFYPNLKDIPDTQEAIVEGLRARDGELVAGTIEEHVMKGARAG